MSSSYNEFAHYYDILTENVDYKVRSDYISNFFSDYGNGGNKMLDLACGTGSFCKEFANRGYSITGIDSSEDMLSVADSKLKSKAKFICADMTDFKFSDKFDFCVCMLDSINHLTDIELVKKCFNCVYDSLNKGGIFVFDVNTPYKHNCILADNTFVFDEEDFFLSWDNECENDNVVRILIDIFAFNGKNYDRFSEEFYEKAYDIDEIKSVIGNFEILGIFDELTFNEPKNNSERIYFVLKRN